MAALRFANSQIVQLRGDVNNNLARAIWSSINRTYWSIMNQLDDDSVADINFGFDSAFGPYIKRWQTVEPVRAVLERSCETLKEAAWVALNVMWPAEGTDAHIICVQENLMNVFDTKYYRKIYKAMLDVSPNVLKIQRAWRRCTTDPEHPMCRRRLLREFEELEEILK